MTGGPTLDPDAFRALAHRAVDLAADHLAAVPEGPVFCPMAPAERAALLRQPLPEDGDDPAALLTAVRDQVFTHPMGNGHPRFFGWVNSPPQPVGIVGDLLASALDPSCAGGDHAAIYLEHAVIRWLMELVGYPTEAVGLLLSGGSMASLTALAVARHRALERLGHDVRARGLQGRDAPLVVYQSSEGHSSLRKSVELLGLGADHLRVVPAGPDCRFPVPALREAIAADRAAGRHPFCVAASAGTVATGAVDPLDEIAEVCAAEDLWFHVDGAYGGFGVLDPGAAPRFRGMERADSLALDPHKWLSVPVECGALLVRDAAAMRRAFSLVPTYLRTEPDQGFGGLPWFSEFGFQQTRGFRALKLWLVLAASGRTGVTAHVRHGARLAGALAARIRAVPELELFGDPPLSIVCFRHRGPDALNRALMHRLQEEGRVFVTQAELEGRFWLRACILGDATQESDLEVLIDEVRRLGAQLEERA